MGMNFGIKTMLNIELSEFYIIFFHWNVCPKRRFRTIFGPKCVIPAMQDYSYIWIY